MIGIPGSDNLIQWKNADEVSHTLVARTITEDFLEWKRKSDAGQRNTVASASGSMLRMVSTEAEKCFQNSDDEIAEKRGMSRLEQRNRELEKAIQESRSALVAPKQTDNSTRGEVRPAINTVKIPEQLSAAEPPRAAHRRLTIEEFSTEGIVYNLTLSAKQLGQGKKRTSWKFVNALSPSEEQTENRSPLLHLRRAG